MNSDPSKLRQEQQQAEELVQSTGQEQSAASEFPSVEALLREDLGQNPAPESIAERLKESIAREPKKEGSWWQRFFRKAE